MRQTACARRFLPPTEKKSGPQRARIMQTREETNTDASLRNTPLAVPLATENTANRSKPRMWRNLFPREVLREPGFSAATILPRHRDVEQCFCREETRSRKEASTR